VAAGAKHDKAVLSPLQKNRNLLRAKYRKENSDSFSFAAKTRPPFDKLRENGF
jgi:hypothetical protein